MIGSGTANGYEASEHGKRRGLAASATANDMGGPGSAYSCARSEICWQNCYSLLNYRYYLLELQH